MLSRNLGTIKKAKEEKRKEAQAEPSDDIILRILRMRPEAQRYLKDRSRQKERLAGRVSWRAAEGWPRICLGVKGRVVIIAVAEREFGRPQAVKPRSNVACI